MANVLGRGKKGSYYAPVPGKVNIARHAPPPGTQEGHSAFACEENGCGWAAVGTDRAARCHADKHLRKDGSKQGYHIYWELTGLEKVALAAERATKTRLKNQKSSCTYREKIKVRHPGLPWLTSGIQMRRVATTLQYRRLTY